MKLLLYNFSSFSDSSKKWQEKADLLTRLENQVKRMKENFDSKEHLLLEERNKAAEAHKYASLCEESNSPEGFILIIGCYRYGF